MHLFNDACMNILKTKGKQLKYKKKEKKLEVAIFSCDKFYRDLKVKIGQTDNAL